MCIACKVHGAREYRKDPFMRRQFFFMTENLFVGSAANLTLVTPAVTLLMPFQKLWPMARTIILRRLNLNSHFVKCLHVSEHLTGKSQKKKIIQIFLMTIVFLR